MAINSSTKFGVVYTTPAELATKLASPNPGLVTGKLYFAAGATSGAIGQGLYVYNDGSDDGDNSIGTVAMVGAGSVVDENHAGLVSPTLYAAWNQTADALDDYLLKTGGTLTGQLTSRNIVPSADSTYDLGTNAVRYKTIYADSFVGAFSGTVSNATNASTADVAKKVDSSLYIKVNNTQRIAYDAGDAKTLDISAGSNVSLSWDSTNNRVTIATTNTTYGADRGISLDSGKFGHSNSSINASDTSATGSIGFGETITIPYVKYDTYGHIIERSTKTFTMPSNPNTDKLLETDVSTGKVYIVGKASNADNNVAQGYVNSSVYMSGGYLYSGSSKVATEDYVSTQTGAVFNFKGNITALTGISNPKPGYSYRNSSTGSLTLAASNSVSGKAETLEPGDIIICTDSTTPKYMVVQNNITNNVNFSATASGELVMFDGNSGTVKNSGINVIELNQTILDLAPKSHKHSYTDISAGTTANQILVSNSNGTFTLTNLSAIKAGDATSADTADEVANTFDISVGGSDVLTFNGSTNKTIAFKGSGSTSVTHSNGVITISSTDNTYGADRGISLDSGKFGHSNSSINASDTSATGSIGFGETITIPYVKYDTYGHITERSTKTFTMPSNPNTDTKVTDSSGTAKSFLLGHTSQGSNAAATTNASVYMSGGYLYSGGTKVSVEGHSHSYLSSQTWRPIKINNSQKLANTSSAALDISAGTNISLNWDSTNNRVTINASEYAIYWETLS